MRYNFFLFVFVSFCLNQTLYSQEYRKEFYKKVQVSDTLAKSHINNLSASTLPHVKTFVLGAKAYLLIKEKKYAEIDNLFSFAFKELEKIRDKKQYLEEKLHLLYFYSHYLVTKHDTQILNNTISEGLELSISLGDIEMQIGFQNLQARYYNLIGLREQALKMTHKAIQKLKLSEGQLSDLFFRTSLTTAYLNGANRSVSLYIKDSIKYKTYIDTTAVFLKNANSFIKAYNVTPSVDQQIQLTNIRGAAEFYKKDFNEAILFYEKGLINASKNGFKKRVFQSKYKIAECNFFLGNYTKAKQIFDELSQDDLDQYRLVINRVRLNYYYANIYQELGDVDQSLKYSKAFNEEIHSYYRDLSEEKLSSFTANELKSKQKIINDLDIANTNVKRKDYYIKTGVTALGIIVMLVIFYLRQQKKRFKRKVDNLLKHISELEKSHQDNSIPLEEEKAMAILTKLKKIEKQQLYTSQSYSLNKVAKKIGSNSTYVSQAVNTYWKKSFTEYTNELRINYILLKLKNDKKYQKFKLEAIAESVGYKSLRSFNKHFKAQTGLLPKLYISLLEKQQLN